MPRTTDPLTVRAPWSDFGHGQLRHLLLLVAIFPGSSVLVLERGGSGTWLGLTRDRWMLLALLVPIVHQWLVVLVWRAQLCGSVMTRLFGDAALAVWGALFLPFLLARPVVVLGLGLADLGLHAPHLVGR
jgi:hypothetical protein